MGRAQTGAEGRSEKEGASERNPHLLTTAPLPPVPLSGGDWRTWERKSEAELRKRGRKDVVSMFVFLFLTTQIYFNCQ